jgi:5-formyltetrahydrofolate cyclo-ligase
LARGASGRDMSTPTKTELRQEMRARLRQIPEEERAERSMRLRQRILALPHWRFSRTVLLFAPRMDEPDVWPLVRSALDEGKTVALPSFDPVSGVYGARRVQDPASDLTSGRFGVREPGRSCSEVSLPVLDLVLVPGLAFTSEGGRLGRGGGFYDRLLAATGALRVGVGMDEQIVPWVPLEPHDLSLDYIMTPSATYPGRGRQA